MGVTLFAHRQIPTVFCSNVRAKDRGYPTMCSQGSTTTKFKYFGNNFYMIRQRTCCYYFSENYLNFQRNIFWEMLIWLENSTPSRHQRFWRYPFSPMEASSRLPKSRDHLFLQSMSKASLPQGPDMWYLTFYENKVPIYQTTISNSL